MCIILGSTNTHNPEISIILILHFWAAVTGKLRPPSQQLQPQQPRGAQQTPPIQPPSLQQRQEGEQQRQARPVGRTGGGAGRSRAGQDIAGHYRVEQDTSVSRGRERRTCKRGCKAGGRMAVLHAVSHPYSVVRP